MSGILPDVAGVHPAARISAAIFPTHRFQATQESAGLEAPALRQAKMPAATTLAVLVDDANAVYPVRIDPTFSDADWINFGGISGFNALVNAAVVDDSGNLYVAGNFTTAGSVSANRVAKWDGSAWSALGSGMNNAVNALAVSGWNLYAGGGFTMAGNKASAYVAVANIGPACGRFSGLVFSPATGFSSTFLDASVGQPYRIQTSPSLSAGPWTDFTNFIYTGLIVITDAAAGSGTNKFFRAITP